MYANGIFESAELHQAPGNLIAHLNTGGEHQTPEVISYKGFRDDT